MKLKRIELFEFEDFHWLPNVARSGVTNLLKVLHKMVGTSEVLSLLLSRIREKYPFEQIVDLGSGSGGAMPASIKLFNVHNSGKPVNLLLTDLYPNPKVVEEVNSQNLPNVQYHKTSVNAKDLRQAPAGLKTMIASFHHMKPAVAKEILDAAKESKAPFLMYEIAQNKIPVLLWWILLPLSLLILILMSLIMTFFVRPLSLPQLFFTFLIPIIPIVYAWDGQASIMRTYTFEDIKKILGEQEEEDYVWEMGEAKKENGKSAGYYLFGYPKSHDSGH